MGVLAALPDELIDALRTQPPLAPPQQRRDTVTEVWAMAAQATPDTKAQAMQVGTELVATGTA
jgi:uncharacterized iron-regulated membrane protein